MCTSELKPRCGDTRLACQNEKTCSEREKRGLITGVIIEVVEIAFNARNITKLPELVHTNAMKFLRHNSVALNG